MKANMKLYRFEDSDSVTKLSSLGQFKRACVSNDLSKGVAMWLLPFFMAEPPATSLTIPMTPKKDPGDYFDERCGVERQKLFIGTRKPLNIDPTSTKPTMYSPKQSRKSIYSNSAQVRLRKALSELSKIFC